MNFYISDTHFGHASAIKPNGRPFNSVEEMDSAMIQMWNRVVSSQDDVYILGDMFYNNEKPEEWYLNQLNGKLHLVIGNHDKRLLANNVAMSRFDEVEKMLHINDNGKHIHACHFPMFEWNGYYKGHTHFYGHIHNKPSDTMDLMLSRDRAYNVGADILYFAPSTYAQVCAAKQRFIQAYKMYKGVSQVEVNIKY